MLQLINSLSIHIPLYLIPTCDQLVVSMCILGVLHCHYNKIYYNMRLI